MKATSRREKLPFVIDIDGGGPSFVYDKLLSGGPGVSGNDQLGELYTEIEEEEQDE
jgi:hypothetical protein